MAAVAGAMQAGSAVAGTAAQIGGGIAGMGAASREAEAQIAASETSKVLEQHALVQELNDIVDEMSGEIGRARASAGARGVSSIEGSAVDIAINIQSEAQRTAGRTVLDSVIRQFGFDRASESATRQARAERLQAGLSIAGAGAAAVGKVSAGYSAFGGGVTKDKVPSGLGKLGWSMAKKIGSL